MGGCSCSGHDELMPVEQALATILSHAKKVNEIETLPLNACTGRIIADAQFAPAPTPAWPNSAMDGYAVATRDLVGAQTVTLPLSQRIAAGMMGDPLQPGTAARIFTGAPVPEGADAVIMQEVCEADEAHVTVPVDVPVGKNIRGIGEDLKTGDRLISEGTRLHPQHVALAASAGLATLPVYRRLKVAVCVTGDELIAPGTALQPGQIYDSNRFAFIGLLQALGCEVIDLGRVADTLEATQETLVSAAEQADLIFTSGGVSVGEEDYVRIAVEALGELKLWRIAMRPGKPLAFGMVNDTPIIGLPGNPVAMFVGFCVIARAFVLKMQGAADTALKPVQLPLARDWPTPDKRREYMRAKMQSVAPGRFEVELHHSRSSGVISSLTWSDGLAILPENRALRAGELVDFLPYSALFTA